MKLDIKILTRKTLMALLLLINIICFFSSQFKIAYTEGNRNVDEYYEFYKPNVKTYSLEKDGNLKLTEDFLICEFRCHDGSDEILIDIELVKALQYIRDYFDKPIHINSAYRTKKHNAEIGGCEESYNLLGQGVDFYVEDTANTEVAALVERMGINGIIVFSDKEYCLHIDSREEMWYAYYSHENNEYEEVSESDNGYYFNFLEIEIVNN